MAGSNCVSLAYGIGKWQSHCVGLYEKGFTAEQASNAIKWTRRGRYSNDNILYDWNAM